MDIPNDAIEIFAIILIISAAMVFVSYFTRRSKNFRSSRNRRSRRQL